MLAILRQFNSYLPRDGDGEIDPQLFCGDQLTVESSVNVESSVANGYTAEDRLEGMNFQIGTGMLVLKSCRWVINGCLLHRYTEVYIQSTPE